MKTILFIRHGSTAGNLEKRYIGRTDEPLCEQGIQQINELLQEHFQPDMVFSSPMLRTRQTAELLFPQQSVNIVDDFRETDFGIFEGKTATELSASPEYQAWVDSLCLAPIPEGESVSNFKARCCTAFEAVIHAIPDESCAALIVHGGVIMSILERFTKPKHDFYDYHIGNGKFILCEWKDDASADSTFYLEIK